MSVPAISLSQLESHLWEAANILRGPVDAADFKTYVFPLLFFKRISDVHDEEYQAALAEAGGDEEYARFPQNYCFQVPGNCHWRDVRAVTSSVGQALQKAMRGIEKANPETLYGIFGDAQWTNKDRLSDALLKDLIEHFSRISLGNQAAQADILGQSYEYLIKKFADATNKKAGEFYTPRPIVRLMVNILDPQERESIYDPTCGTGGMLLEAIHHVRESHGDDRTLWGRLTATFNAADVPNMVGVATRQELQDLLGQDVRKVLITTIHKFGEAGGKLNERSNIIVMVDEAHRTQEGDLGRKMREALPNAFLFGLTDTPINRADKNTFWAFGADEDEKGYLSRYSFQESIRDKATLPLHFEAPEVKLKIDKAAIDEAYKAITGELNEQDRDDLAKRAAKMAVLVKNPERVRAVVNHIVKHFQTKVEPNGFKAQVVTFDRECCVLYKAEMDELIGPEASAVVMTGAQNDPPEWKQHVRDKDAEEKLLDRFRDPADPLQFVIVTSKLLTGFDAPILQVMYLDKPMKDHNLLQAICRTNRTFGQEKTHGLIVDYIGIFDDVARALNFDEKAVQLVVSNIEELRKALPLQVQKCLAFFPGVDRTVGGYDGLMAAQQCLPNNEVRDKFAAQYSVLGTIWEALSPDPCLTPYETDYRWLTQVYESVKPPSGNGKLLWHALGAKTVDLINQNVHVESVRDDVETLVMNAEVLNDILKDADPVKKGREIEILLIARLRRHLGNAKFVALGERLEKIKERHEQGFLTSLQFLKEILELAKDVVEAEKEADPAEERDRAREALTELFKEAKSHNTHIIVERIVADIDDIVKKVRFPDWQHTTQGERLVQKELRKTLLKYQLHHDQDLFDKAYAYIRQYY
jgi:type I restriction enzyme R subunit